ncbi:MAG: class I SAM-dependent methyltransferase [Bacillota bacterium]|nr:class I SAM-dependent methyltransferase [Bacillota bacterium]
MAIDFQDGKNRCLYAARKADRDWKALIKEYVQVEGKDVLDLGCGGGIYSQALSELGAKSVTAMDYSSEMLKGAKDNCKDYSNISFAQGDAYDTGLKDSSFDIVLQRALIHHIVHLEKCFKEAARILKPDGIFIVQDRTPKDCLIAGDVNHIRGYFFEKFPKLAQKETDRRHKGETVQYKLSKAGLRLIEEIKFWEIRKEYSNFEELAEDLKNRTGRSILFELTDDELNELVAYIWSKLKDRDSQEIKESDRWSIWIAKKK